jgi:hypothetical protein
MIPAMIASILIMYWYWQGSRPSPGKPEAGSPEALQQELSALNDRLDAIAARLKGRE